MAIKGRSIKGDRVVHLDLATGTLQCAREQKLSTEWLVGQDMLGEAVD